MEEEKEVWRAIEGYRGIYSVSNLGRVYSRRNNIILTPILNKKYLKVSLCLNGVMEQARINRLVAIAFIPNPENKPEVNHLDGDKLNNRKTNLEWATSKENCYHKINILGKSSLGSKNGSARLNEEQVRNIKIRLRDGEHFRSIARDYKVADSTITMIRREENWKHITI